MFELEKSLVHFHPGVNLNQFIFLRYPLHFMLAASLTAQAVKHLSAMGDTWVLSLGGEDPLEMEMAAHSSTLAWKIPWTKEPWD